MRVDVREGVDEGLEHSIHGRFPLCPFFHPHEESPFVTAIGEDPEILVLSRRCALAV